MKILSIIPVKDLNHTKSRLGTVLDLKERQVLTLQILERTLQILKSCKKIEKVLVLTPDLRVLSYIRKLGVLGLREKRSGLNNALSQATIWSINCNFEALLIIPSDVPFLQKDDIEAIICEGGEEGSGIVIAPDSERKGTNALFVKPPGIIKYSFGSNSFNLHREQALTEHLTLKTYYSTSIGFDLDSPGQWSEYSTGKKNNREDKNSPFDTN